MSGLVYYAGIGSRATPAHVLTQMREIAKWLATHGIVLRSGHAQGADQAFERGCDDVGGCKRIYIPWKHFQGCSNGVIPPFDYATTAKHHPNWSACTEYARKLLARDLNIIAGDSTTNPTFVRFVVCYTKGGQVTGGTGMALRYAIANNIPVFNLGCMSAHDVCVAIQRLLT